MYNAKCIYRRFFISLVFDRKFGIFLRRFRFAFHRSLLYLIFDIEFVHEGALNQFKLSSN